MSTAAAHALCPVRTVENLWIPLADGTRLAARVWLPEDAAEHPVPAVLDAVPYRKSDGTSGRDAAYYTWIAARGYACVRLDLRGSGDSDGVIADEYLPQEQADNVEAIAWLAEREWCDGAVGMIGVSWGGFSALQAATHRPPALRGIVTICASDDRYADDVHYVGGCVSAMDMLQWATSMAAYLGQPPDPAVVGDRWRALWRERLEHTPPFIAPWLGHQRRDAYWRQGSAGEDPGAIACPIFAVGGWVDGYRDAVLRLVAGARGHVRGLIGPWEHTWPQDVTAPGPAIGFLQEVVRFFDWALKGIDTGWADEPRLVSYMQEAVPPGPVDGDRPGRWIADPAWPSPNVAARTLRLAGTALVDADTHVPPSVRRLRGLQACGVEGGVWCADGGRADAPGDQRPDDGASLCWEAPPARERLELLGHVEAVLELSADRPLAVIAARLCDVAPDGASTLIARGVLNLARREGRDRTVPLPAGEPVVVRVPMQSTAYALPPGHALRLAVSPTYWPWLWPSPEPVTLAVHCGAESRLELPVRTPGPEDGALRAFAPAEQGPRLEQETIRTAPPARTVTRDLATGATEVTFDWRGGEDRRRLVATGTEAAERNVTRYRIVEGDPLSAEVDCEVSVALARGDWRTRTEVHSTMSADAERFLVSTRLDAYEGATRVFTRGHTHEIPRDGA